MEAADTSESLGGVRLSPQQRRLWWRRALDGAGPYHTQRAWSVEGEVDPEGLAAALQAVASRYEILGTAFRSVPGMAVPLQVVGGALSPVLEVCSASGPNGETALDRLWQKAVGVDLDPEHGPQLRLWLSWPATGRALLVARASALCLDRVGLDTIIQEVLAACAGLDLASEPLQYADLAEWQNGLVESEEGAVDRAAWRREDFSALAARLPFERGSTGANKPFRPEGVALEIEEELTTALEGGLAAGSSLEIEALFLAVWGVLLTRLTKRAEVLIGTVSSGRSYEGLESVPGLLARVLPFSVRPDEAWRFPRLVRQVSADLSEARDVLEYFLWEDLGTPGEAPGAAWARFGFELVPLPAAGGDTRLVPLRDTAAVDRFAICLTVRQGRNRPSLEIRYDAGAVRVEDARRLAAQLEAVLRQVAADPECRIGELNVLSESERRQLLAESGARLTVPKVCIHWLFQEQAARVPDRVAVVGEELTLTYGELEGQAHRLAHRLRELGIGPDDRVAICLERTPAMVVALLGVLAAGGAYLPLDPLLPEPRLRLFLAESGARALVSEERFFAAFADAGLPMLDLARGGKGLDLQRTGPRFTGGDAEPASLAYVLFTSGSTGVPKGVAVEHRQLVNYLAGVANRLSLPVEGRFAIVSTFAADLGNTMVFPALCFGGCLHVVEGDRATDPDRFAEYMESRSIDCLKIVPGHLQALLTASQPERMLPRRTLILGGEVLSWELAESVRALNPECRVFNHYGPTETTVGVLAGSAEERRFDLAATVPLGRPLANTRIHLVDGSLRPVPTWVAGELFVAGAGLARGYLGRPDLTAERFLPDPAGASGDRLYRTGDLARRLPDGTFEFLGRADGQIKIRGFRIEVGEVEVVLAGHPWVREAAVAARRDGSGELRLVAYIVPNPEQPLVAADLRVYLAGRLPEAMVPAAFVSLKVLPRNPNGKVDRGALPAPDAARPELQNAYEPPVSAIESVLAEIWQGLLGVERVGATDDFFALGGHSLLAVQLISRLRETFRVEVPMRAVFEQSTVRQLALRMEEMLVEEIGQLSDEEAEILLGGAA